MLYRPVLPKPQFVSLPQRSEKIRLPERREYRNNVLIRSLFNILNFVSQYNIHEKACPVTLSKHIQKCCEVDEESEHAPDP